MWASALLSSSDSAAAPAAPPATAHAGVADDPAWPSPRTPGRAAGQMSAEAVVQRLRLLGLLDDVVAGQASAFCRGMPPVSAGGPC